jgi:putative ABC transport system substrate-binding protein
VSVIVAQNASRAVAAKAATSTIPVVFGEGVDRVVSVLVANLNRPGGNITGVLLLHAELVGKWLELLHELVPTATVVLSWSIRPNRSQTPTR